MHGINWRSRNPIELSGTENSALCLVLLKAAERVYGLVKAFARCLSDKRAPEKIRHTLADLIGQRIFSCRNCGCTRRAPRVPEPR